MRGHIPGGVDAHGAEFQNIKMTFAQTHPLLAEEHGAGGIQLDGDAQQDQQPAQGQDAHQTQHNRQGSFDTITIHKWNLLPKKTHVCYIILPFLEIVNLLIAEKYTKMSCFRQRKL